MASAIVAASNVFAVVVLDVTASVDTIDFNEFAWYCKLKNL